MNKKIIWSLFSQIICLALVSQEAKHGMHEETIKGNHRLTTGLGHTHLSQGKNIEGKTVWISEPSWSFNYDYWISNKWAIGLQTDIVLQDFIVEDEHGEELEREKPLAVIPVAIFKPFKHFSFIGGAGVEFEKEENLGLTRLGSEFGVELPKGWETGIALMWDNKWGHYNSWLLEFSFSKNFKKKKKL